MRSVLKENPDRKGKDNLSWLHQKSKLRCPVDILQPNQSVEIHCLAEITLFPLPFTLYVSLQKKTQNTELNLSCFLGTAKQFKSYKEEVLKAIHPLNKLAEPDCLCILIAVATSSVG